MATARPLYEVLKDDGPLLYYTDSVRTMLEYHIPYLLQSNRTTAITIDPQIAWQFEYDFNGLMLHHHIPWHLHWISMRLNGLSSPEEYRHTMASILIPDVAVLDRLVTTEHTIQKPH